MVYTDYTLEQLIEMQKEINSEIDFRNKALKEDAIAEVAKLLTRVNELQEKFYLEISAYDEEACQDTYVSYLRIY